MTAARPYFIVRNLADAAILVHGLKSIGCLNCPVVNPGVWFLNSRNAIGRTMYLRDIFPIEHYPIVPTNSIPHFLASVDRWRRVHRP